MRSGKVRAAFASAGLVRSQVISNVVRPVTLYFCEFVGRHPIPLATWSEEKGVMVNEGGVSEAFPRQTRRRCVRPAPGRAENLILT
jgi:hypothetical protein